MPERCDWPINYAACGADSGTLVPPTVVEWTNGQKVTLSRHGDRVSAEVDMSAVTGALDTTAKLYPHPDFSPAGEVVLFWQSMVEYQIVIGETGINFLPIGGNTAPWPSGTAEWLGAPMVDPPSTGCDALDALTPEQLASFEEQAADLLWYATGGIFGVCDVELRPCREGCDGNAQWASTFWGRGPRFDPGFPRLGGGGGGGSFYPVLVSGQWFNITCGCLGTCRCSPHGPNVISLPGPVVSITEVTIDGLVVDPATYRLDRGRWLIRDGEPWPGCQDMNAAADAVGSFVVRYKRGVPVPIGGQVAAGRLACELAMAACGDEDCALPDNWQTITRQGLTINADPNMDGMQVTGIWSIDEWIKQVTRPKSFASVRSVDLPNLR